MSVDDPRIREQLDACRPDGDDLQHEELHALAARLPTDSTMRGTLARSQRWDAAVQRAMQRVPVPQDLVARLLHAVGDGSPDATRPGDNDCFGPALAETPQSPSVITRGGSLRRRWLVAAGMSMAVMAGAVLMLLARLPNNSETVTQRSLEQEVRRWTASVDRQRWRSSNSPVRTFPISPVLPLTAHRWQALPRTITQEPVICYDLTPRGQEAVFLFVMRTTRRVELPTRPARPTLDTQMLSVGVWRDQDTKSLVYALAVEGNARRFQNLIRPQIARIGISMPAAQSRQFARS